MRKIFALLLSFIIPFTSVSSCIAETLRMPKSLKQIEQGSFFLTVSADTVDIPHGAESIGSQAFAGSGVRKIYIPSTVHTIAPDAFTRSDLTIVAPDGSYAKEFADDYGYAWEDGRAHYKQDMLSAAEDLLDSVEEGTLVLESAEVELLSTEGITDETMLAKINEINQSLLAYEELAKEYSDAISSLTDTFTELADELTGISVVGQDNQLSMDLGGASYTISGDALTSLGSDYEIVSTEETVDGSSVITEITSGGKTYYIITNASGTIVSSSKTVSSRQARAASDSSWTSMVIQTVQEFLYRIKVCIAPVNLIFDLAEKHAKALIVEADAAYRAFAASGIVDEFPEEFSTVLKARQGTARQLLDNIQSAQNKWKKLGIVASINSIIADLAAYEELETITYHGHPLPDISADEQRMDLIEVMNRNIREAQRIYVCSAILTLTDLCSTAACFITNLVQLIPPLAVPARALNMLVQAIKLIGKIPFIDLAMSEAAKKMHRAVKEADDKLHTYVYGLITDAETKEVVPNVAVTNGSAAVVTDEYGFYRIHLFPEEIHTLVLKNSSYKDHAFVVSLTPRQKQNKDIELTPLINGAMVHGTVTSQKDGALLEGVQVTIGDQEVFTDANGSFRFDKVNAGAYPVSFYKPGFARWGDTLEFEEDQQLELNIALADCYVIRTREDLENINKDLMGNYVLANNIDLSGEPWKPLSWFSGTLDGAGYRIDNMTITEAEGDNIGLFVGLYGGHVYNLMMYGVEIDVEPSFYSAYVGAVCGSLNNQSSLLNCSSVGEISVTSAQGNYDLFVGGLAGISSNGYVTDCYSDADVSVTTPNNVYAGGLLGILNSGEVSNLASFGHISVAQSGSNPNAHLKAYGTVYSANLCLGGRAEGSVTAQSTNGHALAVGVPKSQNGRNEATVSATTQDGSATAVGCQEGANGVNKGSVTAKATGNGSASAVGLDFVDGAKNSASITASSVSGSALAIGCRSSDSGASNTGAIAASSTGDGSATAFGFDKVNGGTTSGSVKADSVSGYALAIGSENSGSGTINSGNVTAHSASGGSNANGLRGNDAAGCENSGTVTATADSNQALAIGMYGLTESTNNGNIIVTVGNGDAVAQAMTQCADSTNYGHVQVTYNGVDNVAGRTSVQALNNCTNSTNLGSVTGIVNASTTVCSVTAVSGGSDNVNNGSVRATSRSGIANARGVSADHSQNYADVYAYSSANSSGDHNSATAYGVGSGSTNSLNGGQITAVSSHGSAYAYGTYEGSGCSSTGLVSAFTSHFLITPSTIYYGNAHACNSDSVQATVAGHTVSASNGEVNQLFYFTARATCPLHMGWEPKFEIHPQGRSPYDPYGCYLYCGMADSD